MEIELMEESEKTLLQELCAQTVWDRDTPIISDGTSHYVYIMEEIISPSAYAELSHTLQHKLTPKDTVYIHINTPGGIIDSASMMYDDIKHCKARTVGVLSGTVASAGTLIAMAVDELQVADGTAFMAHNYSSGISGKGHEMKAQQRFTDEQLSVFFNEVYQGFFTAEEIIQMIDGKDFWLNKTEVLERWKGKSTNGQKG